MGKQTTSSKRTVEGGKVAWSSYDGTKNARDINVTQMNIKDTNTGDHIYYNPKQGRQGAALGGAERTGQKKK